jgi:hypothetical protein
MKKVNNKFCETVIVLLILGACRFSELNYAGRNAEEASYGSNSKILVKDYIC